MNTPDQGSGSPLRNPDAGCGLVARARGPNRAGLDAAVGRISEILFIDPSVSEVGAILGGLRPEVAGILLDAALPAARQIAATLADRRGLDAIHIIAHGAPGRVSFAAGEWSLATLERDAADLAAIGAALRDGGELRLWACETGRGAAGEGFVLALAEASGAEVAAATGLVGAKEKGGVWELACAGAPPPLTAAGLACYAGVLAVTLISPGNREPFFIFGSWRVGTAAGTYFVVLNNSGQLQVLGKFIVPVNVAGTFVISTDLPAGSFTVGSNNAGPDAITVYNGNWSPGGPREGTWSLGDFDPVITATLNYSRATPSNPARAI